MRAHQRQAAEPGDDGRSAGWKIGTAVAAVVLAAMCAMCLTIWCKQRRRMQKRIRSGTKMPAFMSGLSDSDQVRNFQCTMLGAGPPLACMRFSGSQQRQSECEQTTCSLMLP